MPFNRTIFNGEGRKIIISMNFLISLAAIVVLAVVSWSVLKVADIPTVFAEKTYVDKVSTKLSTRMDRDHETINTRIDKEVANLSKDIIDNSAILCEKISNINNELKNVKEQVRLNKDVLSEKLDIMHKDIVKKKRTE